MHVYDLLKAFFFLFHFRLARKNLTLDEFDYNKKHITDEIYAAMDNTSFSGVSVRKYRFLYLYMGLHAYLYLLMLIIYRHI